MTEKEYDQLAMEMIEAYSFPVNLSNDEIDVWWHNMWANPCFFCKEIKCEECPLPHEPEKCSTLWESLVDEIYDENYDEFKIIIKLFIESIKKTINDKKLLSSYNLKFEDEVITKIKQFSSCMNRMISKRKSDHDDYR